MSDSEKRATKRTLEQLGVNIPAEELMICDGLDEIVPLPDFVRRFGENLLTEISEEMMKRKS